MQNKKLTLSKVFDYVQKQDLFSKVQKNIRLSDKLKHSNGEINLVDTELSSVIITIDLNEEQKINFMCYNEDEKGNRTNFKCGDIPNDIEEFKNSMPNIELHYMNHVLKALCTTRKNYDALDNFKKDVLKNS